MIEKIEKALKEIRPSLQADGGDVEFVSVENGIVNANKFNISTICLKRWSDFF